MKLESRLALRIRERAGQRSAVVSDEVKWQVDELARRVVPTGLFTVGLALLVAVMVVGPASFALPLIRQAVPQTSIASAPAAATKPAAATATSTAHAGATATTTPPASSAAPTATATPPTPPTPPSDPGSPGATPCATLLGVYAIAQQMGAPPPSLDSACSSLFPPSGGPLPPIPPLPVG
jgi:hypothetical protein